MKKFLSILLILSCVFGLAACGEQETDPSRLFQVYYISNTETRVEAHDYTIQSATPQAQLEELIGCLSAMPDKLEYKAPLAMNFAVLSYRLEEGKLVIDVDEQYHKMSATTEVLVRAAIVCTLTQISTVDSVEITVAGTQLYDNLDTLVGRMTAEDFINNMGSEINNYATARLKLYFANESGDGLVAVERSKPYNTNISLDRLVVEQLIAGPSSSIDGIYPTINPDTKPVSVVTKDGVCYVNLDETFLNQIYNVTADVTIYSIVNSLVELSNVNKVQISINGDTSGVYREKYSFTTVFERNLDLITTLD